MSMDCPETLDDMDKNSLLHLVVEKDRRIQDLERLVEDQKRLRVQDSNQVEEKAARIKEWVTNKLKELENQNKLLRDQNRKQKETVESLNIKLATLSPITSPRKNSQTISNNHNDINDNNAGLDKVHYIDQAIPPSHSETTDVTQSLKTRRPQLKNKHLLQHQHPSLMSSSSEDENLRITMSSSSSCIPDTNERASGVSYISIGENSPKLASQINVGRPPRKHESPLYDSVNIDLVSNTDGSRIGSSTPRNKSANNGHHRSNSKQHLEIINTATTNQQRQIEEVHYDQSYVDPLPPPPPPHQYDKWELQLYKLAEQTFSAIMQDHQNHQNQERGYNNEEATMNRQDSLDSSESGDRDVSRSRKSSSSLKNDFISLVKPSFTNIDGDQVVDNSNFDHSFQSANSNQGSQEANNGGVSDFYSSATCRRASNEHPNQLLSPTLRTPTLNRFNTMREEQFDHHNHSCTNAANLGPQNCSNNSSSKLLTQDLFDTPIRTRSGKDSILRTQSVRKNPAPEKLYDFISADLIKRGYLIKNGALRNHHRWFVLKNFHLYSFKREAEETAKAAPSMTLKLESSFKVQAVSQSGGDNYPFRLIYHDKTLQLVADSARARDEWIKMLIVTINMSDIEPEDLTKSNSIYEGILSVTRHGHSKRCHAILVSHLLFFLKSPIDPTPMSYLSVKGTTIREITDSSDYDLDTKELSQQLSESLQDCSLAIYPKFSLNSDPVYLTLGSQHETDGWLYNLTCASGVDQSNGSEFERTLSHLMITSSISRSSDRGCARMRENSATNFADRESVAGCIWREHSIMLYSDRPILQPLTSLPNETLRIEAVELFKSILLFTQVPLEPVAIDYHVSLLQNCLSRFLKYPELRNEFYAQLIKQSTCIMHKCFSSKFSSSGSSGCSSINQRSSLTSLSPSSSECQFVTDLRLLEAISSNSGDNNNSSMRNQTGLSRHDVTSISTHVSTHTMNNSTKEYNQKNSETSPVPEESSAPSQTELLQVMQIMAVASSLNLPRGRLRWWLREHLQKFANPETNIGKYALFTLKAIDRIVSNGARENVPSRTEIMSILLRNPYDHSTPHSLPVSFADGSCLVVGADGSTTVDEFMTTMSNSINIRDSSVSDFYLFADDPCVAQQLHILEPQRKILDVVGWWEQAFRQNNSGRYQNTRVIKLVCKKRLPIRAEAGETEQERLLIVSQINQEVVSRSIPLSETLTLELAAIMTQLTFGDFEKIGSKDSKMVRCILDKISTCFLPQRSHQPDDNRRVSDVERDLTAQIIDNWRKISGRPAHDCVRVYLNCIRRLKLNDDFK